MKYSQKLCDLSKACLSINNNLCGKLISTLESSITFDERFKVTSVPFFIPDFKSLVSN